MKNLLLTLISVLFCTMLFSQGLEVNKVTDTGGYEYPASLDPTSYPACTDCFGFELTFSVTSPLSTNILNDISLNTNTSTGTVSGFDNTSWILDSIPGPICTVYNYTQELSVCFEIDSTYCASNQTYRDEIVQFNYTVDNDCLADFLNSDPLNDYFNQICLDPNAGTCDTLEYTFVNICCGDPEENITNRNNYDFNEVDLIVSPNPCFDFLTIQNLQGGEEITIYSIIGEKLKSSIVAEGKTEKRINNLEGIPSGVNVLHIARKGKIATQIKFVKH